MGMNYKCRDAILISVTIGKWWSIFTKKIPFMVTENYCTNPECLCRGVHLYCQELDKDRKPVDNGIQFAFSLNLDNWSAEMIDCPEEIKDSIKYIIDAMIRKFDHNIRKRFKERCETAKNPNHKIELFSDLITVDDINSGSLIGYNDIFDDRFNFSAPFIHSYAGRAFCFYDRYCINPSCQCNEVLLTAFYKDTPELVKDEYFSVCLQLNRNKSYEIKESKCLKGEVTVIFNSWLDSNPNIIGILKDRYKGVKYVGKYIVEKQGLVSGDNLINSNIRVKKIGRNDLCPCGSGKKYKKCCLGKETN